MSDDVYAFARFLRQHREAAGLNPRQLADAITKAGGKATTQAVQQWEVLGPEHQPTRPNQRNREAIARVFECDIEAVETPCRVARRAAKGPTIDEPKNAYASILSKSRTILRQGVVPQLEREIRAAVACEMPYGLEFLEKRITPFGVQRRYDYLSPSLAVEWILAVPHPPYVKGIAIQAALWRLAWLNRLDGDTGTKRRYLLIIVVPSPNDDGEVDLTPIKSTLSKIHDETRVFDSFVDFAVVTKPEHVAQVIKDAESNQDDGFLVKTLL